MPSDAPNLTLLTDLYELTMACGYWKLGRAEEEAAFHLFFREAPFGSGYALAAGLADALAILEDFHFDAEDLRYLASQRGFDAEPLFDAGFLDYLARAQLACDVDAVPEGTAVFPLEPLVRVTGPLPQAQILETALLNVVNFQTLVATKASRVRRAAGDTTVLEFGARRAQGPNGALGASRAAFVGGCDSTSNVLAGRQLGIPVSGTQAHSWVMSFEHERDAFEGWARAMPGNAVLLVDTYDSLAGVRHAIEVGRRLRARGHALVGVRLDSGDLGHLAREARRLLDEAGFGDTRIVASGDLDEHVIRRLRDQLAPVDVWGVGTHLAAAWDQPALGGVYKLGAVRPPGGAWRPVLKLSEEVAKISNPGVHQVRRFARNGRFAADAIYDAERGLPETVEIVDGDDGSALARFPAAEGQDLLVPVLRAGKRVYEPPPLVETRRRALDQLTRLDPAVTRFDSPTAYPVGLERGLFDEKARGIERARAETR